MSRGVFFQCGSKCEWKTTVIGPIQLSMGPERIKGLGTNRQTAYFVFPQVKDSRIMMSIPLVAAILQLQTFMMVKQREGKPMASGGFHDSNIWVSLKMRHTTQRAIETMILMMNQITNAFKRPTHVNPHVMTNFTSDSADKATFCLKSSTMESCDFLSTSASIAWITSSAWTSWMAETWWYRMVSHGFYLYTNIYILW